MVSGPSRAHGRAAAQSVAFSTAACAARPALVSLRPWYSGPHTAQITAAIDRAEAAIQRAAQSDDSRAQPVAMPFVAEPTASGGCGCDTVAMIGPRACGSAAPQWIGKRDFPPGSG